MQEGWHRYWSADAWRAWSMQRHGLSHYRRTVRMMRRRLIAVGEEARDAEDVRAEAERNLGWAAALEPCDLGIALSPNEVGLGVVEDVLWYERRLARWVPIGSGPVLVTNRRLVFEGERRVSLRLDAIGRRVRSRLGWELALGSRRPAYLLAGPVDELVVVHQALMDGAEGIDPRRRWIEMRNQANHRIAAVKSVREAMQAQHRSLERPGRPFSPAWVPAGTLVAIGVASALSPSIGTGPTSADSPPPSVLSVVVTTSPATEPDGGRSDPLTSPGTTAELDDPARCHASYVGACVPVGVVDVDCAGGDGDGPRFVEEVEVVGPDEYGLDPDGDGVACEE